MTSIARKGGYVELLFGTDARPWQHVQSHLNTRDTAFFGPTGRAVHASSNFVWRYNRERERKEWYLVTDNSHGCVNVMDEDAKVINDAFRASKMKGSVIVY